MMPEQIFLIEKTTRNTFKKGLSRFIVSFPVTQELFLGSIKTVSPEKKPPLTTIVALYHKEWKDVNTTASGIKWMHNKARWHTTHPAIVEVMLRQSTRKKPMLNCYNLFRCQRHLGCVEERNGANGSSVTIGELWMWYDACACECDITRPRW